MDPETERHLAALIMEEAAGLRMQADKEGVHVYLSRPRARGRPNSQFLQATVRGIQQANRVVEVNEMWRRREKEIELEHARARRHERADRLSEKKSSRERTRNGTLVRHNSKDGQWIECKGGSDDQYHEDVKCSAVNNRTADATDSSSEYGTGYSREITEDLRDEGLNDEEVESFLRSRAKRGRGAVGSRMDEPGPYPLPQANDSLHDAHVKDWQQQFIGPAAGPKDFIHKVYESKNIKRKKKHKESEDAEGKITRMKLKRRYDKAKHKKMKKKRRHENEERASKKRKKYHDSD